VLVLISQFCTCFYWNRKCYHLLLCVIYRYCRLSTFTVFHDWTLHGIDYLAVKWRWLLGEINWLSSSFCCMVFLWQHYLLKVQIYCYFSWKYLQSLDLYARGYTNCSLALIQYTNFWLRPKFLHFTLFIGHWIWLFQQYVIDYTFVLTGTV